MRRALQPTDEVWMTLETASMIQHWFVQYSFDRRDKEIGYKGDKTLKGDA